MTKKSIKSPVAKKAASPKSVKAAKGAFGKAVKKVKDTLKNLWASEATVKSATVRVRRELTYWGLLFPGSRLDNVKVIHGGIWANIISLRGYVGFYQFGVQEIHIPASYPAGLLPWNEDRRCMVDVLRHEFGHALADKYSQFFHDERFKKAFGGTYGRVKVAKEGDKDNYVGDVDYARTFTQEDFCETFMFFLKHKGVLPREFAWREAIRAKWEAVAAICSDIANLRK